MPGFGEDTTPHDPPDNVVQKFFKDFDDRMTAVNALKAAPVTIKSMDNGFVLTAEIAVWVTPAELAELLKETE